MDKKSSQELTKNQVGIGFDRMFSVQPNSASFDKEIFFFYSFGLTPFQSHASAFHFAFNHSPNYHFKFTMLEHLECWKSQQSGKKLVNPIDLNGINDKIKANAYQTIEEYLVDLEWVHHNCHVYFSGE